MYGLADRITRSDTPIDTDASESNVVPLFGHAGVLVLERDGSTTVDLVRACLGDSCRLAVASGSTDALAQMPVIRPGVVIIDLGIDPTDVDVLVAGLAAAGLDAIPLIMIDPAEPITADALRSRVQAAMHVSRRVWFGGGLRSRMVA
jgi:hypothetical protein